MLFADRYFGLIKCGIGFTGVALFCVFVHFLLDFYISGGKFLWLNEPEAKITTINVTTIGNTLTPEILMEYLEVKKGKELFSKEDGDGIFSNVFSSRQKKIISMAPTLLTLSVSRYFNGTIDIKSSERVPLARIGGSGMPLAVSSDGVIFVCRRSDIEHIVSIEGVPLTAIRLGHTLTSLRMAVAALRFLERIADGDLPISISALSSVNVSSKDYIGLVFRDGRAAKLAWEYMTSADAEKGVAYLEAQVRGLAGAMQNSRSSGFRKFDATIKGRCSALK